MTRCEEIGEQIAACPDELPDSVAHGATRALLDWMAAVLIGANHPAPLALRRATAELAGAGRAAIIGSGRAVDMRTATLVNGTAAHAMEVDDIYRDGIYHPGAPTIAAAFAHAQSRGLSGADLLRSITAGYEVGSRLAAAVTPGHYRRWHTTGTVGTIGTAAAIAAIEHLDADRAAHAIALATTMAAGLQQSFRSEAMAKPLHSGHAADAGLIAGLSAANGFTGALDVLEGDAGFAVAMCEEVDWPRVVAPWRQPYCVEEITVKNHTGCGHTFAPVDAMLAIRSRHALAPGEVGAVRVDTARIPITVAGNLAPTTAFEAKFSIPYCIAAALTLGSVRISAFSDETLSDPLVRELISRTELVPAPEFDSVFPHQRAARVTVTRQDGSELVHEAWTRHGDPDDPLTDDELSEKFLELASPVLGTKAEGLLGALWEVRDRKNVEDLFESL